MDGSSDFDSIFRQMEDYKICLYNSLRYEVVAIFLEAKGKLHDAHSVYQLGISRFSSTLYFPSLCVLCIMPFDSVSCG